MILHLPVEFAVPERKTPEPSSELMSSLRWNSGTNKFGVPGLLVAESGKPGRGTHSSLSPFDMHNTLVAVGPDTPGDHLGVLTESAMGVAFGATIMGPCSRS